MNDGVICAIATGITSAGIGIVRVSGEGSVEVTDKIFKGRGGVSAALFDSHTLHIGNIVDPSDGTVIDEVLLSVMRGPKSYTGEDVCEINCHGGTYVCRRILKLLCENGARLAEPGEFTRRAFMNGKMDLSRAEAVQELISSANDIALKNSVKQLKGSFSEKIKDLRDRILHELAFIEAALDDPEHYDLDDYPEELDGKVCAFIAETEEMIRCSENGKIFKDGIDTAIVGKPNAGKSSLLNLLSGRESAIVTDVPGTTRDTLEVNVRIGELCLNLVDTAGIRDTSDKVEKIGVERSGKAAEDAELILFVADSSLPLDENDRLAAELIRGKRCVLIYNKTDLNPVTSVEDVYGMMASVLGKEQVDIKEKIPYVMFTTTDEACVDKLSAQLDIMFIQSMYNFDENVIMANERQLNELKMACRSLYLVIEAIRSFMTEDIFAIDLLDSYKHFGYILGEEIDDDLVDRIFSEFCMGK